MSQVHKISISYKIISDDQCEYKLIGSIENNIELINELHNNWINHTSTDKENFMLEFNPFTHGCIRKLITNQTLCNDLAQAFLQVKLNRRQMDLFEFLQSDDLKHSNVPILKEFYKFLNSTVMQWMSAITGLKLKYASASLSVYGFADHLLPHDDLMTNRKIAFIFYLSPWEMLKKWTEHNGGELELLDCKKEGPSFESVKKIFPENNKFVFFEVSSKSFHHVKEVRKVDFPRLTINGWFHGFEDNKEEIVQRLSDCFKPPLLESYELENFVNPIYLKENSILKIQQQIEENSEVSLQNFFQSTFYKKVLVATNNTDNDAWISSGPVNLKNYEVLDETKASSVLKTFLGILRAQSFFKLLHKFTELDIYGKSAKFPTCCIEFQRWSKGCFTLLSNMSLNDESTLDVIFFLNVSSNIGAITYLASEESPESTDNHCYDNNQTILSIFPKNNALNIVYRNQGTINFTKYISLNSCFTDPYFYIVFCKFKE